MVYFPGAAESSIIFGAVTVRLLSQHNFVAFTPISEDFTSKNNYLHS